MEHGSDAVYTCISCNITIKSWRNFKRHNQEAHGIQERFPCDVCDFKTNRKETLNRHKKALHCGTEIVSCVLFEMVDELPVFSDHFEGPSSASTSMDNDLNQDELENSQPFGGLESSEDEDSSNPVTNGLPIYEYERIKNKNVAECQAMFAIIFAEEISEVEQMHNAPKQKKKKLPMKVSEGPTRKSSRLRAKTSFKEGETTFVDEVVADNLDSDDLNIPSQDVSSDLPAHGKNDAPSSSGDLAANDEVRHSVHSSPKSSTATNDVADLRFGCNICEKRFR